ncbi:MULTISPECIES: hypothetical protein [unclassified Polaromonas]|jgi:hypothetical protein|nr:MULTISPECIES: hypothetical protein [unclassified Polaromonas]HQR99304.1 hypothetical protein [Polaromonas sp.]HQS88874.1 hypothetical protein [Polaromonas sp.]
MSITPAVNPGRPLLSGVFILRPAFLAKLAQSAIDLFPERSRLKAYARP